VQEQLPTLSIPDIEQVLRYYRAHRGEINAYIAANVEDEDIPYERLQMPPPMAVYLDECVYRRTAQSLATRGISIITAQEANMISVCDDRQLRFATTNDWILLSIKHARLYSAACSLPEKRMGTRWYHHNSRDVSS